MRIDVAICTWNRASYLERTLARFVEIAPSISASWSLVVVNNNCTDGTDSVIRSFEQKLPVKRVFEGRPGLSFARNAAIAATNGDILIWTDDDVIVGDRWLDSLVDGLTSGGELVFGRSRPIWEGGVPDWYSARFDGYFAILDYGDTPFRVTDKQFPFFGLNFGSLRSTIDRLGPFRTDFGPKENAGGLGDDTDMFYRALEAGIRIEYRPDAWVEHIIPATRSVRAIQRHKASVGSEAYLQWLNETSPALPKIAGVPRYLYRMALDDLRGYVTSQMSRDIPEAFYHELRLRRFWGMMLSARQMQRRPKVASLNDARAK